MFSKSCEYAIKASIYIATKCCENRRVGLHEIALAIDSPVSFTAKILQKLSKNKIITSTKVVNGGFEVFKDDLKRITLMQIAVAIDGANLFSGCALGLDTCSEAHPCPVHYKFKESREILLTALHKTTLEELSSGIKKGSSFLRY